MMRTYGRFFVTQNVHWREWMLGVTVRFGAFNQYAITFAFGPVIASYGFFATPPAGGRDGE